MVKLLLWHAHVAPAARSNGQPGGRALDGRRGCCRTTTRSLQRLWPARRAHRGGRARSAHQRGGGGRAAPEGDRGRGSATSTWRSAAVWTSRSPAATSGSAPAGSSVPATGSRATRRRCRRTAGPSRARRPTAVTLTYPYHGSPLTGDGRFPEDLPADVYGSGNRHWHDHHLRLEGPVVATLEQQFAERWIMQAGHGVFVFNRRALGRRPVDQVQLTSAAAISGGQVVAAADAPQPVVHRPGRRRCRCGAPSRCAPASRKVRSCGASSPSWPVWRTRSARRPSWSRSGTSTSGASHWPGCSRPG